MNGIPCNRVCVHQTDGYCSIEPGIKRHNGTDICAFLTERKVPLNAFGVNPENRDDKARNEANQTKHL